MDFSEWIRTETKRRGWSQATLAERARLSRSSITAVLTTGRRKPGMKFFSGIAIAFEMPLAEVVIIWEQASQPESGGRENRLSLFRHVLVGGQRS